MTEYYFDTNVIMGPPHRGDPQAEEFFALWNVAAEMAVFTCPDIGAAMGRNPNFADNAANRLRNVNEDQLHWGNHVVHLREFSIQAARFLLSIVSDTNLLFARRPKDPDAEANNAPNQGDYREVWRDEATTNDRLGINDLMIVAAAAADGYRYRHEGPSWLLSNDAGMTASAQRIGLNVIDNLNQAADLQFGNLNIAPAGGFVAQCREMNLLVDQVKQDKRNSLFVTGQAVNRMIQDGGQFVLPAEATALLTAPNPARFVISLGTAVSWLLASHQRYVYAKGIGRRTMDAPPVDENDHRNRLFHANDAIEAAALLRSLLNERRLAMNCRTANGNTYQGIGVDVAVVVPNRQVMQTLTQERFTSQDTSILHMRGNDGGYFVAPNVESHTDSVIARTLDQVIARTPEQRVPLTVLTTRNNANLYGELDVIAV